MTDQYEPTDSRKYIQSLNGSEWGLTTTAWGTTKASALCVMSERAKGLSVLDLGDIFAQGQNCICYQNIEIKHKCSIFKETEIK